MRILILNWRSLNDPLAGGAERATFEHAKRWVKNHKANITWLSPRYDKKDNEIIEGIHFKYIGLPLTRKISQLIFRFPLFYFLVFWTYVTQFKGKIDVVVDEVHGIPFLTPLYVREKIIVYIHEVAGEIWDLMYPFPINKIGHFIEKLLYLPYKKIKFVASPSATRDLLNLGFNKNQITTLTYGITAPVVKAVPQKAKDLTIIFLNRLVKMKGPERAIDIFAKVHKVDKTAKLIFIGDGEPDFKDKLREKIKNSGLSKSVSFVGFVSEPEKFKILSKAHVLLNTSFKEGWGLVNIEANRMGTPVIAYKVKGNEDSVQTGVSGFVFNVGEEDKMAQKIVEIKKDEQIRKSAIKYSNTFNWEIISNNFYEKIH